MNHSTPKTLRVVVVGGAGQMGRHASRLLGTMNCVSRIDVADVSLERASKLAEEIGPKAQPVALDATVRSALDRAFSDVDVVLNAFGPYNLFGRPILEAAIENGRHYVDICDDWEATEAALSLDERARAEGVSALIGLGLSPGLTNILAVKAVAHLDEVDRLLTGWTLDAAAVEVEDMFDAGRSGSAAIQHWLLQCSGQIRAWKGGAFRLTTPLEVIDVDYPGAGRRRVYTLGHPEPITIPRSISVAGDVSNVMSGPEWMIDHLRSVLVQYESGEVDLVRAAELISLVVPPAIKSPSDDEVLPPIWVQARGLKGGEPVTVSAHLASVPPHAMGGVTGYPLALGVKMIAEGHVLECGVLPPERAFAADPFLRALSEVVEPPVAVDDLVVIDSRPTAESLMS